MKSVLVNLSNEQYAAARARLNESARRYGIGKVISWDFEEIKQTPFYTQNTGILDQPRGMGYWLWKPYIMLEAMKDLADGDIVIYSDSGIEIITSLDPLFRLCREEQPVMLFGNGNFINSTWTKRDCFILMDCDQEVYRYGPQCDAAFIVVRRSAFTLKFLQEWLNYACDERILTDIPNTSGKRDLPDFIEHRHDQSILSLLAQKYRLPLFRIPTQYGNHYKMYPYRLENEFNCVSQFRKQPVGYYAALPYYNSPYYQLLDHHRKLDNGVDIEKRDAAPGKLKTLWWVITREYKRLRNKISLWME